MGQLSSTFCFLSGFVNRTTTGYHTPVVQAGLDCTGRCDWWCPREVGSSSHFNQTHRCSFIMSLTMRCELPEGGVGTTSHQRCFQLPQWWAQPLRVLAVPLFYVLWSISGWLANFSTWSGRRDLTYCCGCERRFWSQILWVWIYPFIFGALKCHVLGHFIGVCIFKMRQSDFRGSRFETARDIYFLWGAY